MRFPADLVPASFLRRENRFAATVRIGRRREYVHVPNSGRMHELLTPDADVLLSPRSGQGRATRFDLLLVRYRGQWVGVDSRLPPKLVAEAADFDLLPSLHGWHPVRTEPAFGSGRLDLLLERGDARMLVETKSVNYVEDGLARFPDAPSLRGARHLLEMAEAARTGELLAVWFVVQRSDAKVVEPFAERDPAFAEALAEAAQAGVGVHACRCRVGPTLMQPMGEIPVRCAGVGWQGL